MGTPNGISSDRALVALPDVARRPLLALVAPLLLAAVACAIGGCIPVPTPGKEPFPPALLRRVQPGMDDRTAVRETFGEPAATRAADRYWLYGGSRTIATMVTVPGDPWWLGVGLGSDAWPVGESSWVLVEFMADGRVAAIELFESETDCNTSGVCLLSGFYDRPCYAAEVSRWWTSCHKRDIGDDLVVLTAPAALEQDVRAHRPAGDACDVYYTIGGYEYITRGVGLVVDGAGRTPVRKGTFDWLSVAAGPHEFAVQDHREATEKSALRRGCVGGETIYLYYHQRQRWLEEITADAFAALSQRLRMVLPR